VTQAAEQGAGADTVELTVPADPAYVSVLRTVTASLAARRDFTIDEIDDLRIAVDEASSLLLPHAGPAASLSACFGGEGSNLTIEVSVPTGNGAAEPDQTSFAWMVLAALTDSVTTAADQHRLTLILTKARGARST
jgi:serine/threonine-protein kinase RsbW